MAVDRSYVGAAVLALLAWCCGIVAVSYCFVSLVSLTLLDRLSHKLYIFQVMRGKLLNLM